jgi:hypothetical protein
MDAVASVSYDNTLGAAFIGGIFASMYGFLSSGGGYLTPAIVYTA